MDVVEFGVQLMWSKWSPPAQVEGNNLRGRISNTMVEYYWSSSLCFDVLKYWSVSAPCWAWGVHLGDPGLCLSLCLSVTPGREGSLMLSKIFTKNTSLFSSALLWTENTSLILLGFNQVGLSVHWWLWSCSLWFGHECSLYPAVFWGIGQCWLMGPSSFDLSEFVRSNFPRGIISEDPEPTPALKMFVPTPGWSHSPCRGLRFPGSSGELDPLSGDRDEQEEQAGARGGGGWWEPVPAAATAGQCGTGPGSCGSASATSNCTE